jgi:hypothetical protein
MARFEQHGEPGRLRDAVAHNYGLNAYCERCGRRTDLDLAELVRRLGEDCSIPALRRKLRCTNCGARNPVVQLHRNDWPAPTR